jgi:hypothetical protein
MQPRSERVTPCVRSLAGKAICGLVGSLGLASFGSSLPVKAVTYIPSYSLAPDPIICLPGNCDNLVTFAFDYVLGYHFDIDLTSQVKAVGIFKPTSYDHTVGIWDASNYSSANPELNPLVWQKIVRKDDPCALIGSYCFYDTPDGPTLQGNHKYVVASTWGSEAVPFRLNTPNTPNKFLPQPGFRVTITADSEPLSSGLVVDLSDPDPAFQAEYVPINSQVNDPIGYMTVNLSFQTINEVPGPLPLFGAAAAFGWSRKFRGRIKSAS